MTHLTQPSDFVGKTGRIADVLFRRGEIILASPEVLDRSLLFTGPPGVGKSSLAVAFAAHLTGDSVPAIFARTALSTEHLNGQSCTIDTVRDWTRQGAYRPLFGRCHVKIVDEIDALSNAALNEIRLYLDKLPTGTVFLATTNQPIPDLQPQLQSRFKVHTFEPVKEAEIAGWLMLRYELPAEIAWQYAHNSGGNVRAAKADALNYLDCVTA